MASRSVELVGWYYNCISETYDSIFKIGHNYMVDEYEWNEKPNALCNTCVITWFP